MDDSLSQKRLEAMKLIVEDDEREAEGKESALVHLLEEQV